MLIVEHGDMESLRDSDVSKLLRWSAEELIRRNPGDEGMYRIEDEISEALEITGARYAVEIVELES